MFGAEFSEEDGCYVLFVDVAPVFVPYTGEVVGVVGGVEPGLVVYG